MKKTSLAVSVILTFGFVNSMLSMTAFNNKCEKISKKTGISAWEIKQYFVAKYDQATLEPFAKSVGQPLGKVQLVRKQLISSGIISNDNTPTTLTVRRVEEIGAKLLGYFISTGEITAKNMGPHAYSLATSACVFGPNGVPVLKNEQLQVSDIYWVIEKQVTANQESPVYSGETVFGLATAN